jgi:phosphoglycerate kinase
MKKVTEAGDLKGKYVVLRSSLNIPLKDGKIRNKFRLERALPTMRYLHEQGAKVIVVAHIGRDPEETLKPVFNELEKYLPVHWGGSIGSEELLERKSMMGNGDILLVENLRQNEGEKNNDEDFIQTLSELGEIYVNDAFAAAHREHASTFGITQKLPAYAGLTLSEEVTELTKVMTPAAPSLFLLGGAKFDTKMPLVEKYLEAYSHVFIGGALANDVLKAQGYEVGESMVSDVSLVGEKFLNNPKLLLPIDVIVNGPSGRQAKGIDEVKKNEAILDCGPMTIEMLASYIEKAKTVLWNGPFGAYEMGYTQGTEITARHIAAKTDSFTVIGGGDTVAAVEKLEINDLFSFVSIGGGSMLTLLEKGTTPAIESLN